MAVVPVLTLICDVPSCTEDEGPFPGLTADAARLAARDGGWHHSKGKDIGPECWDAGWRYGRDGWTVG